MSCRWEVLAAIFEEHKWGDDASILGVANVPVSMIKADKGRYTLNAPSADGTDPLASTYLKDFHQTQLTLLKKDSKKVAIYDTGTSSPASREARKRSLEDTLREDVAANAKLTPASKTGRHGRAQSSASAKSKPWYMTGESGSLTQQLNDKIRVLHKLHDAMKEGEGEIVIDIPHAQDNP